MLVRVGGHPLQFWVEGEGEVPGLPFRLTYSPDGGHGYVLATPMQSVVVRPDHPGELHEDGVEISAQIVRRFWLPRWVGEQADGVLPVIALAVSVMILQFSLLTMLFVGSSEGGGSPEPSPEYLERLLRGEHAGEKSGVTAVRKAPRPTNADPIEGYYLQAGHGGPHTKIGGGKNLGDHIASGNPDPPPRRERAAAAGAGDLDPIEPVPVPDDGTVAEAAADPEEAEKEEQPAAVHVTEGWGLNDWYDTTDAREDAKDIQQGLDLARQLLRLDPDDPTGLNILAYYHYLAMDYAASEKVYTRMTVLYPDDSSGWNNLALTFKRRQDYVTEENLYRIAIGLASYDDHALNNLAVCLAHQGRFEEAEQIMKQLETLVPDDAYADLHRAKLYAAWGKPERAYGYLERSLRSMRKLDTLHNIEFRQDIRIDPVFEKMRQEDRFRNLLLRFYGDEKNAWWKKPVK